MDITADLTQALLRRETKEQVARLLRKLSVADRRAVMLDLLAENAPAVHGVAPVLPIRSDRPRRGRPPKKRQTASSPSNGTATLGRTETLVASLTEKPRMPIRELAFRIYGDDGKQSQNKARSLLAALKGQGRVRNVGAGQWEVIA